MAGELNDIKAGLKAALEEIPGLRVFDQPREGINDFPAAVIIPRSFDYMKTLGDNTFDGVLRVVILIHRAEDTEGFGEIDKFVNPVGTESVRAAIAADPTLGGVVDSAHATGAEEFGIIQLGGGRYQGATVVVEFIKTVG